MVHRSVPPPAAADELSRALDRLRDRDGGQKFRDGRPLPNQFHGVYEDDRLQPRLRTSSYCTLWPNTGTDGDGVDMEQIKDPFRRNDEIRSGLPEPKFEAGEHQWLGLRGAQRACVALGLPTTTLDRLQRRAGDVELSYGEIVALSGDFYASPEDLFDEKPAPIPWLYEQNDLSDLRKAFATELDWIKRENRGANVGYPNNNIAFAWNAKSYVELALDNTDHFGWHNVVAYCRYHEKAIDCAISAGSESALDEGFRRALYYNGFADHFLTDGFAAGHIRVPRQQIRSWASEVGYDEKLAGLLSKLLHDQDGHVSTLHAHGEGRLAPDEGLPVRNARGVEWSTRCDGQLFIVEQKSEAPLIAEPVAAVTASLVELYTARRKQQAPAGEYEALKYVPFPRPGSSTLTQKFPADLAPESVKKLVESVAWYFKLPWAKSSLGVPEVERLLQALPKLMQEFRRAVVSDYERSAELRERLPDAYVEAFQSIA